MKHSKLSLALAGLIGVTAMPAVDDVMAMSYHVQGDRIFLSGGVTLPMWWRCPRCWPRRRPRAGRSAKSCCARPTVAR
jgi:hypothetical protein